MYSSRRFGRTLTSMRASSSNACPDTIRSGCLCCIIRFAVPSAIVSAAHTPNSQSGLNGAQRAAPPQRQRATRRGRYDLLARSMTAMRRAANSRNSPRLLRASLRPQRFPPRVRRIPGSPARTPRPPRFPRATRAPVSRSPRPRLPVCLSTRPPCAPPSCAPRRQFSSNARGRARESPARVLRRSSPTGSSAPASAPRRKPKAASQKNAFPARRQIRIAPAHLPAHGCGSRGSLRCANRRARRTSRAAPARGTPRRPRQRAPDSVFFRQAVREAGQSSLATIAAFPSPVNAPLRLLGFYSGVQHCGNHLLHTEAGMSLILKEIESHYLESRERERLSADRGELERLRTEAILARPLPPPPAPVVDAGGAAGASGFPLAHQGF